MDDVSKIVFVGLPYICILHDELILSLRYMYPDLYLRISRFIFTKYQTERWQAGLPTDTSLCLRFRIFILTFSIPLPPEVRVTSNSVQATGKGNCLISTLYNHLSILDVGLDPRNKIYLRKVIFAF